jgi:aspartate carbamoyltransferase catalytic subunit
MARNIVTIDDLATDEVEALFALADEYLEQLAPPGQPHRLRGQLRVAEGCVLSTLFYEPSTRTRFSFESAMHRLGGNVLSSADPGATSAAKGETIADTIRVVQSYADLIVIRHPSEGAARVAADYADVPVINAGDGGHEHPTQTLCDLYTLRREKKRLHGLNVQLRGDLKHGRTVHSLVCALARFGANIMTSPAPGLDLPRHVVRRLEVDHNCVAIRVEGLPEDVDAVYVHRPEVDQGTLPNLPPDFLIDVTSKGLSSKDFRKIDIFYVTRLQAERLGEEGEGAEYPIVDARFLKHRRYRDARVLHPLPRVNELGYDLDQDDRALYFKQAAYGVPVRMALLAALLGLRKGSLGAVDPKKSFPVYTRRGGIICPNPFCVTRNEREQAYLSSRFWVVNPEELTLRCVYCEHETRPQCVGRISRKRYDTDVSRWGSISMDDLILFEDGSAARAQGYQLYKSKAKGRAASAVTTGGDE